MKITTVHPRTPEYAMPFVPAMLVEGARYLFVAGCGPVPLYHKHPHDPDLERASFEGGIREQTRRTFENIKLVLDGAGATLNNVVRVLICLATPALNDLFSEFSRAEFGGPLPPRTFVTVPALVHKDMRVEIGGRAALPADGGGRAGRAHPGARRARNRRTAAGRKASGR